MCVTEQIIFTLVDKVRLCGWTINKGIPRLCRGTHKSLVYMVVEPIPRNLVNSSYNQAWESIKVWAISSGIANTPRCVHPQKGAYAVVFASMEALRAGVSWTGKTEGLWSYLMVDHVHMCLSILPKYPASKVAGFIKGQIAISIVKEFRGKTKNFTGESFWA